jgi:hydrogenase maturation protease
MNRNVVIGYGNNLRSDDGIGQKVANALDLPNVKSLAVHQLTPELVDILASANLAIFVDACLPSEHNDVQIQHLEPSSEKIITGHAGEPQSLLALTKAIYGHCPQAWWITVPGVSFQLGENLSPIAEKGVASALEKITQILKS